MSAVAESLPHLSSQPSAPTTPVPAPGLQPVFLVQGLPGFSAHQHYLLEPVGEARYWLRSEEGDGPSFAVIEPHRFIPGFAVRLPEGVARNLGARRPEELKVLAIVTLPRTPEAAPTVNLQGLLVLNEARGLARQVILPDSPFDVQTPLPVH
jgi:flagellar assembly factor FliW